MIVVDFGSVTREQDCGRVEAPNFGLYKDDQEGSVKREVVVG